MKTLVRSIDELQPYDPEWRSFYYLATPYSKYPHGLDAAYEHASLVQGYLLTKGVKVFCPIAHSHGMARYYPDFNVHEFWMDVDRRFMRCAHACLVVLMEGWADSRGVAEEIFTFERMHKPVLYLDPAPIFAAHGVEVASAPLSDADLAAPQGPAAA